MHKAVTSGTYFATCFYDKSHVVPKTELESHYEQCKTRSALPEEDFNLHLQASEGGTGDKKGRKKGNKGKKKGKGEKLKCMTNAEQPQQVDFNQCEFKGQQCQGAAAVGGARPKEKLDEGKNK